MGEPRIYSESNSLKTFAAYLKNPTAKKTAIGYWSYPLFMQIEASKLFFVILLLTLDKSADLKFCYK